MVASPKVLLNQNITNITYTQPLPFSKVNIKTPNRQTTHTSTIREAPIYNYTFHLSAHAFFSSIHPPQEREIKVEDKL
jgi:hypothetical protein